MGEYQPVKICLLMGGIWKEAIQKALDLEESYQYVIEPIKADIIISFDAQELKEVEDQCKDKVYVYVPVINKPRLPKGCAVIDIVNGTIQASLKDIIQKTLEKIAPPID